MSASDMSSGRPASRSADEERRRFGLLLLAIVAAFAVQGVAAPGRWEQLFVAILLATTLVLATWVGQARRGLVALTTAIAAGLVALSLAEAIAGHGDGLITGIANLLLVTLAPPMVVVGVVRTLRMRGRVTVEALFGVLCVYLLLGMFFAFLYGVVGHAASGFFSGGTESTTARNLYFSFATLTTVGYGDLTAATDLGHTLSVSEALLGQVYLVTVVSVIVANLGLRRPGKGGS